MHIQGERETVVIKTCAILQKKLQKTNVSMLNQSSTTMHMLWNAEYNWP